MKKTKRTIVRMLLLLAMLVTAGFCSAKPAYADEAAMQANLKDSYDENGKHYEMQIEGVTEKQPYVYKNNYSGLEEVSMSLPFLLELPEGETQTVRAVSSNKNVIQIEDGSAVLSSGNMRKDTFFGEDNEPFYVYEGYVKYRVKGDGVATITLTSENMRVQLVVCINPLESPTLNKVFQTGSEQLTVEWTPVKGYDGYAIKRTPSPYSARSVWEEVARVRGEESSKAQIQTAWEDDYVYCVSGLFVTAAGDEILSELNSQMYHYKTANRGSELKEVKKQGSSSLAVSWNKMNDAAGYMLYCASSDNGSYTCIYEGSDADQTTFLHKVSKGKTYVYYLVTKTKDGRTSVPSKTVSAIIPLRSKAKSTTQTKIDQIVAYHGQYAGAWADSENTFYYEKKGKQYVVCLQNDKNLCVYTLDQNMKCTGKKKVKLPAYDRFGGFYAGTDGKFYVAIGYNNYKEKDNKVVIKVLQYNNKWKLKKTAKITGDASNKFKGIYEPFSAGNCRMDQQGNLLYLFTCREMYVHADGKRHQSNITFAINTQNMKWKSTQDTYCSHSFNQYVKFKDGSLYQIDHGDAYGRGIQLTITDDYTVTEKEEGYFFLDNPYQPKKTLIFQFEGSAGDNFTGATIGGMEVGKSNVLVCGTALPHGYKIKGVSGMDADWKQNVFLVLADRQTGKSTVKWITKNNPKKTKVTVSETRMVKLSDSRFAILYNEEKDGKNTLNYYVVNDTGKKVYSRTYKNMHFTGDSQPILYKGSIHWTTTYYDDNWKKKTKSMRIPAIF